MSQAADRQQYIDPIFRTYEIKAPFNARGMVPVATVPVATLGRDFEGFPQGAQATILVSPFSTRFIASWECGQWHEHAQVIRNLTPDSGLHHEEQLLTGQRSGAAMKWAHALCDSGLPGPSVDAWCFERDVAVAYGDATETVPVATRLAIGNKEIMDIIGRNLDAVNRQIAKQGGEEIKGWHYTNVAGSKVYGFGHVPSDDILCIEYPSGRLGNQSRYDENRLGAQSRPIALLVSRTCDLT